VLSTAEPTAAVDTGWHALTIKLNGKHQQILLDGEKLFEGEDDRIAGGSFSISPGWGSETLPVKFVEIDDLQIQKH
jgi:hypothetical protein